MNLLLFNFLVIELIALLTIKRYAEVENRIDTEWTFGGFDIVRLDYSFERLEDGEYTALFLISKFNYFFCAIIMLFMLTGYAVAMIIMTTLLYVLRHKLADFKRNIAFTLLLGKLSTISILIIYFMQ